MRKKREKTMTKNKIENKKLVCEKLRVLKMEAVDILAEAGRKVTVLTKHIDIILKDLEGGEK